MKSLLMIMIMITTMYGETICSKPNIVNIEEKKLYCQERVFNAVQNLIVHIMNDTGSAMKTLNIVTTRNLESHEEVAKQMSLCYDECML